jgi:hypothetical protein
LQAEEEEGVSGSAALAILCYCAANGA